MPTLREATIPEIAIREVAEAINQVSGFRAEVELMNETHAKVEVDGPIQNPGLTPDRYSLLILIGEEHVSLSLMPSRFFNEELSSPLEALNALDDDLANAVGNCFELRNPECFDQLADALIGLGMLGLPSI